MVFYFMLSFDPIKTYHIYHNPSRCCCCHTWKCRRMRVVMHESRSESQKLFNILEGRQFHSQLSNYIWIEMKRNLKFHSNKCKWMLSKVRGSPWEKNKSKTSQNWLNSSRFRKVWSFQNSDILTVVLNLISIFIPLEFRKDHAAPQQTVCCMLQRRRFILRPRVNTTIENRTSLQSQHFNLYSISWIHLSNKANERRIHLRNGKYAQKEIVMR